MDNQLDYQQYITIDRGIRFGKPCIKGTRISVTDILEWLASGMTVEDILEDFPELNREHVFAALSYAADRNRKTRIAS